MTQVEKVTTYSCRAECECDAIRVMYVVLEEVLATDDARFGVTKFDSTFFGTKLEFVTTLSLNTLLTLFAGVRDTHVMQQTLRAVPLAENSLERGSAQRSDVVPTRTDTITELSVKDMLRTIHGDIERIANDIDDIADDLQETRHFLWKRRREMRDVPTGAQGRWVPLSATSLTSQPDSPTEADQSGDGGTP